MRIEIVAAIDSYSTSGSFLLIRDVISPATCVCGDRSEPELLSKVYEAAILLAMPVVLNPAGAELSVHTR
jgi:hypothetical protein